VDGEDRKGRRKELEDGRLTCRRQVEERSGVEEEEGVVECGVGGMCTCVCVGGGGGIAGVFWGGNRQTS
jgi:hypothetical protein